MAVGTHPIADALTTTLDETPPDLPAELLASSLLNEAGGESADLVALLKGCDHPDAPRLIELLSTPAATFAGGSAGWSAVGDASAPAQDRVISIVPISRDMEGTAAAVAAPRRKGRPGPGFQLKVQLRDVTEPPVWRRLLVPADIRLDELHEVIQVAMGWEDYHLHVFSDGRNGYGTPDPDLDHGDETRVRLSRLLTTPGDEISYTYDFGDGWEHDIVLEEILKPSTSAIAPTCITGEGACPPEDCGGAWGYEDLKATLSDPDSEEHDERLDWLGLRSAKDFDPRSFSAQQVNRALGVQ